MNKKIIPVDCDGFLFDTVPLHVDFINMRWEIETTLEDYREHPNIQHVLMDYLGHAAPSEDETYEILASEFLNSVNWQLKADPIDGITSIIPLLADMYELHVVTARQDTNKETLHVMLEESRLNPYFSGLHFGHEHVGPGIFNHIPKSQLIQEIQGEKVAFFDDAPKYIVEVDPVVPSFLFDPHHFHTKREDLKRFGSIYEIPKIIKQLETAKAEA